MQGEILSALSKFWTQVAESILYGNNHYAINVSLAKYWLLLDRFLLIPIAVKTSSIQGPQTTTLVHHIGSKAADCRN